MFHKDSSKAIDFDDDLDNWLDIMDENALSVIHTEKDKMFHPKSKKEDQVVAMDWSEVEHDRKEN